MIRKQPEYNGAGKRSASANPMGAKECRYSDSGQRHAQTQWQRMDKLMGTLAVDLKVRKRNDSLPTIVWVP